MMPRTLDPILIETYGQMKIPADRFIGDAEKTKEFLNAVRDRAGRDDLDASEVMQRLVSLRKTGKLPRLNRQYFGRSV